MSMANIAPEDQLMILNLVNLGVTMMQVCVELWCEHAV